MTSRRELYAAGEPFGDSATRTKPGGRIYGGGSGGGGSSTTVQSIPDELKPLATAYTNKAMNLGNQGFNPYYGQRYEDLNTTQNLGIGMIQDRALNGDATQNAGASFLQNQLGSGPRSATQNPVGGVSAGTNAYAGANPYLDAAVSKAQASVLGSARGADVRSGSFGNSGIAEQAAKQMGDVAQQMYFQDYGNQQQLAESGLNRSLQAQQFNSNLGNDFAQRNDAMFQNYVGNNLNAANLGLQYGNRAYQDAQQLMNAGQIMQDQNQQNLDFNYNQFQEAQNLPYKQLASMAGVFGSGLGSTATTSQSGGGK